MAWFLYAFPYKELSEKQKNKPKTKKVMSKTRPKHQRDMDKSFVSRLLKRKNTNKTKKWNKKRRTSNEVGYTINYYR